MKEIRILADEVSRTFFYIHADINPATFVALKASKDKIRNKDILTFLKEAGPAEVSGYSWLVMGSQESSYKETEEAADKLYNRNVQACNGFPRNRSPTSAAGFPPDGDPLPITPNFPLRAACFCKQKAVPVKERPLGSAKPSALPGCRASGNWSLSEIASVRKLLQNTLPLRVRKRLRIFLHCPWKSRFPEFHKIILLKIKHRCTFRIGANSNNLINSRADRSRKHHHLTFPAYGTLSNRQQQEFCTPSYGLNRNQIQASGISKYTGPEDQDKKDSLDHRHARNARYHFFHV